MATREEAAKRLIVAADYDPKKEGGLKGVKTKIFELFDLLAGTGAIIKFNSILLALGFELIAQAKNRGLDVFADLKRNDIPNTLKNDAGFLAEYAPAFVTVMCNTGEAAMQSFQLSLPATKVLGVTVLTSFAERDSLAIYRSIPPIATIRLARLAQLAGLHGIVCSAQEIEILSKQSDLNRMSLVTPGIRPAWAEVPGDDQSRVMTPAQAIKAGSNYLVVGRPIVQATNPSEAFWKTVDEIREAIV